jgi:hypothetical protein
LVPLLTLIACTKSKAPTAVAARELYRPSKLFRLSWQQAQLDGGHIAILSAKHGLVLPDRVIAPYNETLVEMADAERAAWARQVGEQFTHLLGAASIAEVTFLAGRDYREPLVPVFRGLGLRVRVHPRWALLCEQAFR